MEVLFKLGSSRDDYVCPLCASFVPCDWGIECMPVVDCIECDFVGVLVEKPPVWTDRTPVGSIRIPLRAVKHVRVDENNDETDDETENGSDEGVSIDPPCVNACEGAKAAGVNIVNGNVVWLTTTDGVVRGYHKDLSYVRTGW
jgi:hypothetical protein